MGMYIIKRLLLMIPTLFLILLINFLLVQVAPGGPVEQAIHQVETFQQQVHLATTSEPTYQGSQGLSPQMLEQIKAQYGFDQPASQRFWHMLKNYMHLDFGHSFFKDKPVITLLLEKMPVTIALGLSSTLFIYLIAIPLGIHKAKQHGLFFDQASSLLLALTYAMPAFVFGVLLIVFFAGGSYFHWFPLQGIVSDQFDQMRWFDQLKDVTWHLVLPVLAMVLGGFARLTYLNKYAFLEELNKPYVLAAKAQGLSDRQVLYRHVFQNAILVVVAGLPEALLAIFFVGNLLIEIIFNLDGVGLLGFEAITQRDYPVIFATLFIYTLFGLLLRLVGDVLYQKIDPRIDFSAQGVK